MINSLQTRLRSEQGFALSELLVVIIISASCSRSRCRRTSSFKDRANKSAAQANVRAVLPDVETHNADNDRRRSCRRTRMQAHGHRLSGRRPRSSRRSTTRRSRALSGRSPATQRRRAHRPAPASQPSVRPQPTTASSRRTVRGTRGSAAPAARSSSARTRQRLHQHPVTIESRLPVSPGAGGTAPEAARRAPPPPLAS